MSEFVQAALSFPAVLFTFSLVVVIGYWTLVVVGGLGIDLLDADADVEAGGDVGSGGGLATVLSALGLNGVPVTIVLSLVIVFGWFTSMMGMLLADRAGIPGAARVPLAVGVLVAALLVAWVLTRLLSVPLGRLFRNEPGLSHEDLVGRVCRIQTGTVDAGFGQAEVKAAGGHSSLVQVRRPDLPDDAGEPLKRGDTALIFDYDAAGGVYLVMPAPPDLDPDHPAG